MTLSPIAAEHAGGEEFIYSLLHYREIRRREGLPFDNWLDINLQWDLPFPAAVYPILNHRPAGRFLLDYYNYLRARSKLLQVRKIGIFKMLTFFITGLRTRGRSILAATSLVMVFAAAIFLIL